MREILPAGFSPALHLTNCLPIISVLFAVPVKMNLKNMSSNDRVSFFPKAFP